MELMDDYMPNSHRNNFTDEKRFIKIYKNYEKYLILEKIKIAQGHRARKYPSQDPNPGTRVLYSEPLH